MTSGPLAQLSPDVSPSSRPRPRFSSNHPPALGQQRDSGSSHRERREARRSNSDETGVCVSACVCDCGWGDHQHVCDHVCVRNRQCWGARVCSCAGQRPCECVPSRLHACQMWPGGVDLAMNPCTSVCPGKGEASCLCLTRGSGFYFQVFSKYEVEPNEIANLRSPLTGENSNFIWFSLNGYYFFLKLASAPLLQTHGWVSVCWSPPGHLFLVFFLPAEGHVSWSSPVWLSVVVEGG